MSPLSVALVAACVLVFYGPGELPYRGDRSYFAHLAQVLLQGDSIYRASFVAYLPLTPLLGAAAMWLGSALDVPNYLAPRYLGFVFVVGMVVLTYFVSRRITGSSRSAAIGALAVAGSPFTPYFGLSLEPKFLVGFFTLLTCACIQRGSTLMAGAAMGLAVSCWQGSAVVLAPAFVLVLLQQPRPLFEALRFTLGVLTALVPSLLYLGLTDSWWELWQRSVDVQVAVQLEFGDDPMAWVDAFLFWDWAILPAAIGFVWFIAKALDGGARGALRAILDPKLAALPLITVAWVGLNFMRYRGEPDLVQLLPFLGVWIAYLVDRGELATARLASRVRAGVDSHALRQTVGRMLVVGALGYALFGALVDGDGITLEQQRDAVRKITSGLGPDDTLVAFEAEEIMLFSERRSVAPFLRTHPIFMRNAHLVGAKNCRDAMRSILEGLPTLIVIDRGFGRRRCVNWFEKQLPVNGYHHNRVSMVFSEIPGLFDPRYPARRQVDWQVYRRSE